MLTQPSLTPHPTQNKYQLARDYRVMVQHTKIVIPRYFRYDGASIPAAAWVLTFSPFHPDVMLPSLVHDWMYYNHQQSREETDDLFYDLLRDNGVSYAKASVMWAAVRSGGELFWENDDEDIQMLVDLCKKVQGRPNFADYSFPPEVLQRCGL